MTIGRPTEYNPAFCEKVLKLGAQGMSKAQIAAALGCSRRSIDIWRHEHEEFMLAIAHAQDLAMSWWEHQAQKGLWQSLNGDKLNPQLWSRSMAARFPDDYREKSAVDLTSSDGTMSDSASRTARLAQIMADADARKKAEEE